MPSTLFWIDHDREARDRTQRILALFEERDTRDELGIGAIRDSFSDLLFPGTSTIQTRLRYFLIVPWVYRQIEADSRPAHRIAAAARELELDVAEQLLEHGYVDGVFGRSAGRRLKRLPSEVYWAGLRAWEIRKFDGSKQSYHASIERVRSRREAQRRAREEAEAPRVTTWHPALPDPPADFPDLTTLELTREEAEFISERILASCRGTLLAHFVLNPIEMTAKRPWLDPRVPGLPDSIRALLEAGRRFSDAMHGASLVYNYLLARKALRSELTDEYRERLLAWADRVDVDELRGWDLAELWQQLEGTPHRITFRAREFVESWFDILRAEDPSALARSTDAARLITARERQTKGGRSRLENARMLEQWGGASSPDPLDYRWNEVTTLGNDLWRGLQA